MSLLQTNFPFSSLTAESFPDTQRTEAHEVLETLQELQAKEHDLQQQLNEKNQEIQDFESQAERMKAMKDEIDQLKDAHALNQTFLSKAKALLATPGQSEREIMEKKLLNLKTNITQKEGILQQKRSSYETYKKKLEELHASKLSRLTYASEIVHNLSEQVEKEMIPAATGVHPTAQIKSLLEICHERESEIAETQKELDTLMQKDREVTTSLQSLQENIQEAIPRVEAEKDEVAQGILNEWEVEKQNLIRIYGRLCVINREQNYHLMRGTHIKRSAKVDKQIGPKETRLNIDNTELAREINNLRDKVNVTEADVRSLLVQLTHIKKLNESERKNFQGAKAAAEEKVQEANHMRQEMQIENNELRKLKNELLGVLQSIRENHLTIQRNALVDSQPPIEAVHRLESGSLA